jgi:hypothetical protein
MWPQCSGHRIRFSLLLCTYLVCSVLFLATALAGIGCMPYVAPVDDEALPDVQGGAGDSYLFCFWNLENFFDDKVDGYGRSPDKEYDRWFGGHPEVFKQKLHNISKVIAGLNDGRGPDILAVAEVETTRAAELLMQELNQRLPKGGAPYKHLLMKEVDGGRHIATAIITRLPVEGDRTQLLGKRQRILEGHIVVNGNELVVIASDWPSRGSDREGEDRGKYASQIYGRFQDVHKQNRDIAFLVCG